MDRQPNRIAVRRALVSVSDKTGLVELGKGLAAFGVEILSTGGTRKAFADAGVATVEVAEYTGFPEMFDGRVKTLHPKIHGGLLQRRDVPDHLAAASAHGIKAIDLVVVNLYPFEAVAARANATPEEVIENIDIGGPAMIRSAAKNHEQVGVVTDPSQYPMLLAELRLHGGALSTDFLRQLAVAAFARTAAYDAAIHRTLARLTGDDAEFPTEYRASYRRLEKLRYGENPHQRAAVYVDPTFQGASAVAARKLHGKELSYNNLLDLDSALAIVREFARPTTVVVKHNNPCGTASADDLQAAFRRAWDGDPVSAFGSIVGCNRIVDKATAEAMVEPGRFIEAVIAPDFAPEAVELLTKVPTWKASVRLLATGALPETSESRVEARPIAGGLLLQTHDAAEGLGAAKVVTQKSPTPEQRRDLEFAWRMVKHVRSNAIVLAANEATVGVGAGQMSRVDAGRIAIEKAGPKAAGCVLASDAFFPFRDNVDQAAKAGVAAIVQPGGSKRDQESIDACNEHGVAMIFTGVRCFKH